jgi:predicted metal-dependent phosphoesterase TrpH
MPDTPARSHHFEGALQPADSATFITYPFDVENECTAIRLRLSYAPYRAGAIRNLITLGLFDPHGFRGQAHRGPPDAETVVSTDRATPGYIAGPLPAGCWQAQLAVFAIVPGYAPCNYTLEIEVLVGDEATARAPAALRSQSTRTLRDAAPGPRWLRGELHSHTTHSDGQFPTSDLLELARQRRLDFIAITDHNTVGGWNAAGGAAGSDLVVIPGLELTTFHGHAVALGVEKWIDWRTGHNGWTINDAARATHDAGGLFIIAHPWSNGSPGCTGCRWEYGDMDMSLVDGMEVWSSYWPKEDNHNPLNLAMWKRQPRPITAVAAADFHGAASWGNEIPATYVYASELSVAGILDGIKQGRVVLTVGPWLELRQTPRRSVLLEDILVSGPTHTNLSAGWRDAPHGARLHWCAGDTQLGALTIGAQGAANLAAPPGRVHLEMWSADGNLLAMTNPITMIA